MSRLHSLVSSVLLLSGTLFFACQGDDPSDSDGVGGHGGGAGAPSSAEVTRTLGQKGGELATSNTTVFVPSGALPKSTELTVSDLSADEVELLPETTDGVKLTGFPSKFTPHGLTFDQAVDVSLSYEPPEEGVPIVAMKLDNDQDTTWEVVPGGKFESGTASFKIDGFSIYACFEDPNGLAEMLYGPDVQGSGGSGSGGAGSGGESSGGTSSGGAAAGGSAGSGGSGGSGGGSSLFGYLDTPTFHGFGYSEQGTGASITTDVETAPAPNCAAGETGATAAGTASLVYYVNQGTDHIEQGPLLVPDAGLWLQVTNQVYRSFVVELRAEPGVWCAPFYTEVSGPQFIPWEAFDAIHCVGAQSEDAFDPTSDAIVKMALTVPSNQESVQDFDYCIDEISTGIPNGYMDGPTWSGYGVASGDGMSTFTDDLSDEPAPNCITGTTDAAFGAYAELGYNLDEPVTYGPSSVTVPGTGLELDLVLQQPRDLQVRLQSAATGPSFCAELDDATTGPFSILWEDFRECDTGVAFVPANAPIERISVRVKSSLALDPFNLCIERLEADIPIG